MRRSLEEYGKTRRSTKMAAEEWRQCVEWLVQCQILPSDHKATKRDGTAFDLAQALRDGVLICHLLNQLKPGSVDPKDFSPRPQMSQVCFCFRKTVIAVDLPGLALVYRER